MTKWDIERSNLRSLSSPEIGRFWEGYVAFRKPVLIERGSLWSRWRSVSGDLVISIYLTNRSVGLFVRGQRGERYPTTVARLSTYEPGLGKALGASLRGYEGCCYLSNLPMQVTDTTCWPQAYERLAGREEHYYSVLGKVAAGG